MFDNSRGVHQERTQVCCRSHEGGLFSADGRLAWTGDEPRKFRGESVTKMFENVERTHVVV
ncbi:MAG: hypothetical protein ABI465_04080 [Ktedonobacteraceae bacterium]